MYQEVIYATRLDVMYVFALITRSEECVFGTRDNIQKCTGQRTAIQEYLYIPSASAM